MDMRDIGSSTTYSRASYRILLSGWGQPGGSDVRKLDNGLTRKCNIPLYWRKGLHFPGQKKLEKYCASTKIKYNKEYVDPDRDLFDMGGDFRTPSGEHGQSWSKRNRPTGRSYGVEMRILDYFPPRHMSSLLRVIVFIIENSRKCSNKLYVYEDKDWIGAMHSAFKKGWRAKLPLGYINKLEKELNLKFPKKPLMLLDFWKVFLQELYNENHKGYYVNKLLPRYLKNDDEIGYVILRKKQPTLEIRNPNRESYEFGF